ncbi:3-keto-disaccharide hydrolase [Aquimarina sp. M1]
MRKLLCLFLSITTFISCNEKKKEVNNTTVDTTTEDVNSTPKKEITDPKETEVWDPEPETISFNDMDIPSDALVLFDGSDLDQWVSTKDSTAAGWIINADKTMTVKSGTGDIQTKKNFGSVQLHLEWKAPNVVEGKGQGRGNSGVFFQNKYEVQILDSYQNRTYANGQATAIYKQHIPLVNATKPNDQWQTYDIIFHAPEFGKDGKKIKPGTFTVIHNGVLVQDHVEILGSTEYIGPPKNEPHTKGPIKLQDHSNPVHYRNIWVREI